MKNRASEHAVSSITISAAKWLFRRSQASRARFPPYPNGMRRSSRLVVAVHSVREIERKRYPNLSTKKYLACFLSSKRGQIIKASLTCDLLYPHKNDHDTHPCPQKDVLCPNNVVFVLASSRQSCLCQAFPSPTRQPLLLPGSFCTFTSG